MLSQSLHSLADLSEEIVVGVPGVEFHVVPEVDGDAPVGLTQVVEPQARQVQHVPRPHPDVEWVSVLKFWKLRVGIVHLQEKSNIRLHELAPCGKRGGGGGIPGMQMY